MSDYYRDRCRHGGILSNAFINFWWNRQILPNQYGKPGRAAAEFKGIQDGPRAKGQEDTIEGDLPEDVLVANRRDQNVDNANNKFRDDEYYSSKEFNLEDIEVPLLSVANWGGILLHLRGNVEGYTWAGSKLKYLRFIVGRHDLPFYYHDEVEIQKSFLDAFLKGKDTVGWSVPGKVAPVSMVLRKGNVGFNNPSFEATYARREEPAWPIPRTQYTKYYLHSDGTLSPTLSTNSGKKSYKALGTLDNPQLIQFSTPPFEKETEITGHVVAHLNVSMTPETEDATEKDIDLFLTLRYIAPTGEEVHYTGTAGDPIPLAKGWLRVSLRKIDEGNPKNRPYFPYRKYYKEDVQEVKADMIYTADVEIWPTNVIAEKGGKLVFEVSSGDTQGSGVFQHNSAIDR
jgi:predicted acyl esterase